MKGEIVRCYDDSVVFVTGGTGFLGKILLQKLLRFTLVRKIFILVRCKKNKNEAERYAEIFEQQVFDALKQEKPDYKSRVELITGDCALPNMGISDNDWKKLKNSVNFVFHCAATVRFDQKIKTAAYINVRATLDLVKNAKQFKYLKALVYVSTAYSNCPRKDISEKFYEPGKSPNQLLDLIEILSDEELEEITPKLIGKWPNTYVFTKCISEDVIRTQCVGLPVAIVRPSIVVSTYKDPMPGWIDNFYGPLGITSAAALGILRTLLGKMHYHADLVPADYVINALVATAWNVSQKTAEERENVSIFNYATTPENPMTWKYYMDSCYLKGLELPLLSTIYKPLFHFTEKLWLHNLKLVLLHWVPAYIVDFICLCTGKKRLMVAGYERLHKFIGVIQYFTCREWNFENQFTQKLWEDLGEEDKKLFPFSMKTVNWDEYLTTYLAGGRVYLLKDSIDTIPASRRKLFMLNLFHYVLVGILLSIFLYFLYICFT